jgi:aminopeptidase YwaD
VSRRSTILFAGLAAASLSLVPGSPARAEQPFLPPAQWNVLRDAASGAAPYENLRFLTTLHRVPATAAFDQAADFMLAKALEYGLKDAHAEQFPIDGVTPYGLMRSHLGWQVESARLWETAPSSNLIADWSTDPIRLADYSHGADVQAALIDVGSGTNEADYTGKDVSGKLVLADGILSRVQELAVMNFGAAGIVSDMPNQATAWSGLDTSLVRWGHLDARLPRGFAFMVSRATATALRAQLAAGSLTMSAHVQAEVGPGHWTVVTATIPGSDPKSGEIVYSCHLDHQRPGANDNGSGCVTILESARLLNSLINEGKLPRPPRTLRFIWGPEVEGTMAFLAKHPDIRQALRADIHMDMVGGDPFKNKSILHVSETPWSLPSFVTDVGAAFAGDIREAATVYTEGGDHAGEAVVEDRGSAPGTRNAFFADVTPYAEGSDHDDYDSSTIAVPSLYLRDWPDVYIHTDHDSLDRIDATKLRRVALLGAASGYTYASLSVGQAASLLPYFAVHSQERLAHAFEAAQTLLRESTSSADGRYEAHNLLEQARRREIATLQSFVSFVHANPAAATPMLDALNVEAGTLSRWLAPAASTPHWRATPEAARIPHRIGEFGPLNYQNDDVLEARLGAGRVEKIQLLSGDSSHLLNVQERGALYAYEVLNFVDGKRTVADIRDAVAAEYGPLPLEMVTDYLKACEEAKIVAFR